MSLDPKTWLSQARSLEEGQHKRVGHVCGEGACMVVEHTADGWRAYCHRCADNGFVPHERESLEQKMQRLARARAVDEQARQNPALPQPMNREPNTWPLPARVWFYKAGLTNEDISILGAYWNEYMQRVVIPVRVAGRVVFWQARNPFTDGRPKYISPSVDRQDIVAAFGDGPCLVLTEDILSAYKVGKVTEAWSLLGVKVPDKILARLVKQGKPIKVWLDPDWNAPGRPGQVAASKIRKVLASVGIASDNILSRADPKMLCLQEIHDAIQTQE